MCPTYDHDVNQRLAKYQRFGVHLGLDRIQRLLKVLENPHTRVPIVHVAGTNGKGSVCAYLASALKQAGYRVGRYTSPHLVSWCERICINEVPITTADLIQVLDQVEGAIVKNSSPEAIAPDGETPTQFEIFTAVAWVYFAQQVDIAVIEVGLGGRLDATNVVDHPLVSVITSLSREHWQQLGPTVADIAREKAGILKAHRPAIIGPLPPEADNVVIERAIALNCPIIRPLPAQSDEQGYAVYAGAPSYGSFKYAMPLPGDHQLTNSAIAIAALHCLRDQGWQIPNQAIQAGIGKTRWPGRLQWLIWQAPDKQAYPWLLDGAHNPAAARVLRNYADAITQPSPLPVVARWLEQQKIQVPIKSPITWLMGLLTTKDHADVFRELLRPGDRLHLVPVPNHSSMEPKALQEIALTVCPNLASCETYEELADGLAGAIVESSGFNILCGSLYLVGHFFQTQPFHEPGLL